MWLIFTFFALAFWSFNPHTYMRCDTGKGIPRQRTRSFNPHTYMRCDEDKGVKWVKGFVSIHTPTWGVTKNTQIIPGKNQFQSTHLHEVWQLLYNRNPPKNRFQSTHLHEVWHMSTHDISTVFSFNPHTYMRCDILEASLRSRYLFQSTHLHEVWQIIVSQSNKLGGFNPHTYMRCDSLRSCC